MWSQASISHQIKYSCALQLKKDYCPFTSLTSNQTGTFRDSSSSSTKQLLYSAAKVADKGADCAFKTIKPHNPLSECTLKNLENEHRSQTLTSEIVQNDFLTHYWLCSIFTKKVIDSFLCILNASNCCQHLKFMKNSQIIVFVTF